jgi:heparinase II/III-like protein
LSLGVRLGTARALGFSNLARVLSYRLLLRTGLHPVQRLGGEGPLSGPFFRTPTTTRDLPAPRAWRDAACYFGWFRPTRDSDPPDWHRSPFDGGRVAGAAAPWWTIPDFDPEVGDIKAIWEASRFDWVVAFAQQGAAGEPGAIDRLNRWLADWCSRNPPYLGPNWKCAQEASIRVMHLALAALCLGETAAPCGDLVALIRQHLRRIRPTIAYARGQENNHGTSEAAALLIGGSWQARLGHVEGAGWAAAGRRLLEERVQHLVAPDGSFSQYSVTYHRLMLDTLSLAEVWRQHLQLAEFSLGLRERAAAASRWLRALVDPATGDAPNLGANDGTNLLPLTDAEGRDFRPSVELATTLFEDRAGYATVGSAQLQWLGVSPAGEGAVPPATTMFSDGGLTLLVRENTRALLRFPRFRFRPSHADALHLDLWVGSDNLLRDGGSFSYAADSQWQACFGGAAGHNTIQFDGREQMPRLGRFLWGDWLRTERLEPLSEAETGVSAGASYRDRWGAGHHRRIRLAAGRLDVTDRVDGFRSRALLRWRLRPGSWRLEGAGVSDGQVRLEVSADVPIVRLALVTGWESRYYLQKSEVPVLELEVHQPGTLTTVCRWR